MNSSENPRKNAPGGEPVKPSEDYKELIMHWLDGDLDGEQRAAVEAGLQQQPDSLSPGEEIHDVVGLLRSNGLMEKTALQTDILMRWLDGEMTPREQACFETLMASDEQLSDDAKWMRRLGIHIRGSFARDMSIPRPDEFNRRIQEQVAQIPLTGSI